jgi:alpha-mannosidase
VALPAGSYNRVYVLASAVGGDVPATFTFERKGAAPQPVTVRVQEWEGAIGQWDSRLTDDRLLRAKFVPPSLDDQTWPLATINEQIVTRFDQATRTVTGLDRIAPGFVKRAEVALVATHRHATDGNQPYVLSYVFAYALDVPKGATAIRLPANDRVRILAMTAADETAPKLSPAATLYAADLKEPAAATATKPAVRRARQQGR